MHIRTGLLIREQIAADIVRVLREELIDLLDAGAALVQFDEPVLSEVVFSGPKNKRSFMCGALSESLGSAHELGFAKSLMNAVTAALAKERIGIHVCRGNWTTDESVALSGSYAPLVETLAGMNVGAYLLEMCTPRAGEMEILKRLPDDARIGIGVVNQKVSAIEAADDIVARMKNAIRLFGRERVMFHPDCGFATFADNPICPATAAEGKLRAVVQAVAQL